jgi:hypothetical protein
MHVNTRYSGLDELLEIIYGRGTRISTLLCELGFEHSHVEQLYGQHLEPIVSQFLEVIHKRLTSDSGKDTYFQILSRRYGLDGEPPQRLTAIATSYGYSPEYVHQIFDEIIDRCQRKAWKTEFKRHLKYIAVAQLGKTQNRPTHDQVAEKLERLSNLRNAAELTRLDYETKRAEILKQVQPELDALEAEYQPVLERAAENFDALENEIKTDVLLFGESVSGGMYSACYTQGRVSWDNDGMARYASFHPELLQFRKQGRPIVSLRVSTRN